MIERPGEEFNATNEQLAPSLALIGQEVDILRDLETQGKQGNSQNMDINHEIFNNINNIL